MKTLTLLLVLLVATPASALTRYGFVGTDDALFPGAFWLDETAPLTNVRTLPTGPQPWGTAADVQSPDQHLEGLAQIGSGLVHFEGLVTLSIWDSLGLVDGAQGPACYACVSLWGIHAGLTGSSFDGVTPISLSLWIYAHPGADVMGPTPPEPMAGNPPIYNLFWSDGHWDFGYWTLRPDQAPHPSHPRAVPEPATVFLLGAGLGTLILARAWRRPTTEPIG